MGMKWIAGALALPALVAATMAGCRGSVAPGVSTENSNGAGASAPAATAPAAAADTPPPDGRSLLGPFSYENLAVFLIADNSVSDAREFITLDEGLESGQVIVNERGSDETQDNSAVNTLEITNRSGRWLYIEAGEVVKGGKQDRTLGRDLLVKPGAANQPLAAFCVEQGRWSAGSSGNRAERAALQARGDSNIGSYRFAAANSSVSPKMKLALLKSRSQAKVWEEVAEQRYDKRVTEESESGTYVDVINSESLKKKIAPYLQALGRVHEEQRTVIGAVFVVDGRIVAADEYGAPGLFARLYPKLLASHAREAATSESDQPGTVPSEPAVWAFLREAHQGTETNESTVPGQLLRTCENDRAITFDAKEGDKLMHRNTLKK